MFTFIKRMWNTYISADRWIVDYYFFDRRLSSGEVGKGYLARKKIEGRWVYRHATPDEVTDTLQSEAW